MRTILNLPQSASREEVLREYRKLLYLKGAVASENNPPAFDLAEAQKVVEQEKGELSLGERYGARFATLATESSWEAAPFGFSFPAPEGEVRLQAQARPDSLRDPGSIRALGLSQTASPDLRLIGKYKECPSGFWLPSHATARSRLGFRAIRGTSTLTTVKRYRRMLCCPCAPCCSAWHGVLARLPLEHIDFGAVPNREPRGREGESPQGGRDSNGG